MPTSPQRELAPTCAAATSTQSNSDAIRVWKGGGGVEGQRTEQRACQHGQRRLRPHDHALHGPMRPIRTHTLQGSDVRQR